MKARTRARWIAVTGLAALAAPARAHGQAAPAVTVSVDATAAGSPLERVWPFYGYDEINNTTTPEGAALLGTVAAANTAPVHVRSHFLLNTGDGTPALKWGSTNVYTEDAAGQPIYSWTLTDGIMDTITGAGAAPLVELGFMPQALSTQPNPYRNSSTTTLDGGCFYPPTDYGKWGDLIRAWATHAAGRYPDAGTRWLWELWNEPDIGYWKGTFDEYAKLYDTTEAALHEVLPDAPLGGPAVAVAAGSFLKQFLQHCATGTNAVTGGTGTRLDLVTFHAKGGVTITDGHVEMALGSQLRLHQAGFKAVAAVAPFKQTPIYVTEADPEGCAACPVSSAPEDAYRFSPAYGAYEIAMMKHSLELEAQMGVKLGGLLTWAFTFPGTPYFAGYRALATNGINLPVMSAFKLLGRLDGVRLPLTSTGARPLADILANGVRDQADVDGLATSSGGAVQVLVWNYHDDLVAAPPTPVHLSIAVPADFGPRARIAHLRADESHGDAYTVWVSQGMPATPSPAQVAALQAAMDPSPASPDKIVAVVPGGAVRLDFDLPRFGVSLLTVTPDFSDGGLDAGGAPGPIDGPKGRGCNCGVDGAGGHAAGGATLLVVAFLTFLSRGPAARRRRPNRPHPL
ncbi:MAG TPA: beta-xylosidase [Polyangia bacterium]|nr:beta-xylosidase [Polyangia bacterium]